MLGNIFKYSLSKGRNSFPTNSVVQLKNRNYPMFPSPPDSRFLSGRCTSIASLLLCCIKFISSNSRTTCAVHRHQSEPVSLVNTTASFTPVKCYFKRYSTLSHVLIKAANWMNDQKQVLPPKRRLCIYLFILFNLYLGLDVRD